MLKLNLHLNTTFLIDNQENKSLINGLRHSFAEDILEIFAFKNDHNIISYESLEFFEENKGSMSKRSLSDLILKNLFVDLKKFSLNHFDSNIEDIKFTNIKL